MVSLTDTGTRSMPGVEARRPTQQRQPRQERQQQVNVGQGERAVSVAAGSILALLGLSRRTIPGLLVAGVGGALAYRGATGHCSMYEALGVDTAKPEEGISERGIHVEQSVLINRSPQELYQYWRNFTNLPQIMSYLQSVQVVDERRSHWVATAPSITGGKVEWDAQITQDTPNELIAWRSLEGSDINATGEVRFSKALGDRGTIIHVFMDYIPPAGRLGHWAATIMGKSPRRQMREDLRNLRRIMETGEIPTIKGQPHGTCMGLRKSNVEQ